MKVHLIDGTYELFRQHFGMAVRHGNPGPHDAAIGVVNSTLQMATKGATHLGIASDHVIESFRNDLYPGYKTSEGMDPGLLAQIPVMEALLTACGFTVWPMVQWEADDALAAAAAVAEDFHALAAGGEIVTHVFHEAEERDVDFLEHRDALAHDAE